MTGPLEQGTDSGLEFAGDPDALEGIVTDITEFIADEKSRAGNQGPLSRSAAD